METISYLMSGFSTALLPNNILAMVAGALLGIIVGALPGIGGLTGVALLLPMTYSLSPTTAIIMLCSIYYGNMYGGAYSAIMINIPGDNSAVMTALDGYPMARRGLAGKALFTSNFSSFIGGTIGIIILTFFAPSLAELGLKFGAAEMTSLLLVAMTSLGWMVGERPLKGLVSAAIGIILATIGSDPVNSTGRFYFGVDYLLGGVQFIPLVVGVFGFSQLIEMMGERYTVHNVANEKPLTYRESLLTRDEFKRIMPPTIRTSLLGTLIGILPGAGGSVANFLGYVMEKRICKNKEQFGTGCVEGVAAAEASNNAAVAGALAPLLSLGIPGSGTTAVLLGGLIMWGLTPGPLLFVQNADFAWGLIASMYIGNLFTLAVSLVIIPGMANLARVPTRMLIPIISVVCFVGAYSATNSLYGVIIMLLAGLFGYAMNVGGYPTAPMLLAFVLAPMLEENMRKAFVMSFGSPLIFIQKPISLAFLIFLVITLTVPAVKAVKRGRNG